MVSPQDLLIGFARENQTLANAGRSMASVDPDYDLAIETYSAIWTRYEQLGFDKLTEQERTIFCTWQFVCEVNNGGFHLFLFNPSGEFAQETVVALENVQMHIAASLLKRVLRALPDPAKDHQTRARQLVSLPQNIQDELFKKLTEEFFDSQENAYTLQADYVRKNPGSFLG
jgi:hypothetical protein